MSKSRSDSSFGALLRKHIGLRLGNFFFRYRNLLFPITFFAVPLIVLPDHLLSDPRLDWISLLLGIGIALTGQGLRLLVIGLDYIRRGGRNRKIFADTLVVGGMYAHCRNPMYVANILLAIGICTVYGSLPLLFTLVPIFFVIYWSIVVAEELYLTGKFGEEYRSYQERVPAFMMKCQGLLSTLREFEYDWKKALRKEYGTIFGTFTGLVFIITWKSYYFSVQPFSLRAYLLPEILFVLLLCFYLTVRYLKHSDRLGIDAS